MFIKIIIKKIQSWLRRAPIILKEFSLKANSKNQRYICPLCGHSFSNFLPAGLDQDVLKEKKVIGGGYRKNCRCPFCESRDRERLVYVFLLTMELLKNKMNLLHVAPERKIKRIIEKKKNIEYFSADLEKPNVKIKMDIQNINFPANYFDGIICNHVLEHIIDDKKAMKELYRVLKPNGWAILQVPYSPIMEHTLEDSLITTKKQRKKLYGQGGHVRIYGLDYINRLESVGFSVKAEKLNNKLIKKYALNPDEKIFFCRKNRKK